MLSEFAGAAAELETAFLVNPHDVEDLKRAITDALNADTAEQAERMRPMRDTGPRQRHRPLGPGLPHGAGQEPGLVVVVPVVIVVVVTAATGAAGQ